MRAPCCEASFLWFQNKNLNKYIINLKMFSILKMARSAETPLSMKRTCFGIESQLRRAGTAKLRRTERVERQLNHAGKLVDLHNLVTKRTNTHTYTCACAQRTATHLKLQTDQCHQNASGASSKRQPSLDKCYSLSTQPSQFSQTYQRKR